jgi:hypothetical protein
LYLIFFIVQQNLQLLSAGIVFLEHQLHYINATSLDFVHWFVIDSSVFSSRSTVTEIGWVEYYGYNQLHLWFIVVFQIIRLFNVFLFHFGVHSCSRQTVNMRVKMTCIMVMHLDLWLRAFVPIFELWKIG